MRTNCLITEFVNDAMTFYLLVNRADVELHDIYLLNNKVCELVYKHKDEFTVERFLIFLLEYSLYHTLG